MGEYICETCIHRYCCKFTDHFKQSRKEIYDKMESKRNDILNHTLDDSALDSENYYLSIPNCLLYETICCCSNLTYSDTKE